MTVLIYVDTSKRVGDPDHLKVFANADAAETWFAENDPEGVAFEEGRRLAALVSWPILRAPTRWRSLSLYFFMPDSR